MKISTTLFDFCEPIKKTSQNNNLNLNLESQLKEEPKSKSKNRRLNMVFICFLLASLLGISYFGYSQWQEKENLIARSQKSQVAGIRDEKTKNIIPGENFSFIMENKTPDGFAMTKKNVDSNLFDKKNILSTSFIVRKVKSEKELVSGIQILISEYDFKLDQGGFATFVKEKLGDDWTILSEEINLPGQIKISKITKKDKSQTYYTTATKNYYYIIQILTDTKNTPEYTEINQFTDQLLPSLHLN